MRVCEVIESFLHAEGLKNVYGMSGANIEDVFLTLSQRNRINITINKQEGAAVLSAMGEYLVSGKMGLVLATSGGGLMNTIPALAEAYASRIPVMLIAGLIPTSLEGLGGFQDGSEFGPGPNYHQLLKPTCEALITLKNPCELFTHLRDLKDLALNSKRPVVLLIPKNLLQAEISPGISEFFKAPSLLLLLGEHLNHQKTQFLENHLTPFLNALTAKLGISFAPGIQGLQAKINQLKIDNFNSEKINLLGMTGVMGSDLPNEYLKKSKHLILLGTSFDLMTRYGLNLDGNVNDLNDVNSEKCKVISINEFPPTPLQRENLNINFLIGSVPLILKSLTDSIFFGHHQTSSETPSENPFETPLVNPATWPISTPEILSFLNEKFCVQNNQLINSKTNFFIDAGNTGAFCLHHLLPVCPFHVSLGMGAMGNSLPMALGGAQTTSERQYVFTGDGSLLITGLELHTAIQKKIPLTVFIFNNQSHGMCTTREIAFFDEHSKVNDFFQAPVHFAQGFKNLLSSDLEKAELSSYEIFNITQLGQFWHKYIFEDLPKSPQGVFLFEFHTNVLENPPFKSFPQKNLLKIKNQFTSVSTKEE
jgi:acetolactate synthase-1/2/3 large subunit